MPSLTANICVWTLVLLSCQQICQSTPLSRNKRGLVKDYFVPDPLVFSTDKFDKGDDGKYYLKKSAHMSDSEVTYSSDEKGNNVLQSEVKSGDTESVVEKIEKIQAENAKEEPSKEEVSEKVVVNTPTASIVEEAKIVKEIQTSSKTGSIVEESEKKKMETSKEKAPFTPTDPKFTVPSKPDSKDEIGLKTDLPPVDVEEKVEEKITIGQFPDMHSRLVPVPGTFRVPVIIPIRHVSYGAVKVVPLPPAEVSDRLPLPPADVSDRLPYFPPVEVSDRLPLPYEDDIVGEGAHESESELVSEPIAEKKKDGHEHSSENPLVTGISLPTVPFHSLLKDLETDARNSEKQAKVVDVLGKKFLMQSNVMKYPTGDNGHLFLRFLSVKPLEERKSTVPKEISVEESLKKSFEAAERKSMKELEKKEASTVKEEVTKKEDSSKTIRKEREEEISKDAEILKAEETQIKMLVEEKVPKIVIIENMGESDTKSPESVEENKSKEEDVADERKMYKTESGVLTSDEFKGEEKSLETTESKVVETKVDISMKESANRNKEIETKFAEVDKDTTEEAHEKAVKIADGFMQKGDSGKDIELTNKKDFFLIEKKKKFTEETEEVKHKKKSEKKKKKKCKCEDSDSDDDEE